MRRLWRSRRTNNDQAPGKSAVQAKAIFLQCMQSSIITIMSYTIHPPWSSSARLFIFALPFYAGLSRVLLRMLWRSTIGTRSDRSFPIPLLWPYNDKSQAFSCHLGFHFVP